MPIVWILRLAIAFFALVVLVGGALGFIYSGFYPIAADRPHLGMVQWALTTLKEQSVARYSAGIEPPNLRDADLVRAGLPIYQRECLVCHGAPGTERPQIGRGINPNPPRLAVQAVDWDDSEIFWIIKHGLKMAGMPAFDAGYTDVELWAVVAFVRRLPEITVEEYERMLAAAEGRIPAAAAPWLRTEDPGYSELYTFGDVGTGRRLLAAYGCGSCHVIPGVRRAVGAVGPPLTAWAERHFIAGSRLNTPNELVRWIADPKAIEPETAMPDLGVSREDAMHMAAYLYTLGRVPFELRNLASEAR